LQNGIGNSKLKDIMRNGFERDFLPHIYLLPMLLAAGVFEYLKRVGIVSAELRTGFGAQYLDIPVVFLARYAAF